MFAGKRVRLRAVLSSSSPLIWRESHWPSLSCVTVTLTHTRNPRLLGKRPSDAHKWCCARRRYRRRPTVVARPPSSSQRLLTRSLERDADMPFPPPPPPPPAAGLPGPPPPPALPAFGGKSKKGGNPVQARDQLLQSIRQGKPLKKTVTVDKSKPLIDSEYLLPPTLIAHPVFLVFPLSRCCNVVIIILLDVLLCSVCN